MKKNVLFILIFSFLLVTTGCNSNRPVINPNRVEINLDEFVIPNENLPVILIDFEEFGHVIAQLYPEYAPITVENFLSLVDEGFYDGLTFHRIINRFMIQGGDPDGTGMGGSGTQIIGEFSNNGIDNPIEHRRGVLSMARAFDFNSASSQFFIMHADSPHLDGGYAGFGSVIEGIEIIDRVVASVNPIDRNGTVVDEEQPVIRQIRLLHSGN